MKTDAPTVAYVTAGAGGMICGSCLADNTLATALRALGVDAILVPVYTPIRTDQPDASIDRVFFGGLNVMLEQKSALARRIPNVLDGFLANPGLLRWIGRWAAKTDARDLGDLTVSMLQGAEGRQAKEVARMCRWFAGRLGPQILHLSNMLIAGAVPQLKRTLGVPVAVTLQGDDLFVEQLPQPYRSRAVEQMRRLAGHVDAFLVHSRYYADKMASVLDVPSEKIHVVRLGIDGGDFGETANDAAAIGRDTRSPAIGYLARLAPEKGFHLLADAFIRLRRQHGVPAELDVAGWLGDAHRGFAEEQFNKLRSAGLEDSFRWHGTVDRAEKIALLRGLDVFSVPTVHPEPKGIFVLEALAAGVPVVAPDHGAFRELLEATGGGRLVRPDDAAHLAEVLAELLENRPARDALAREGRRAVLGQFRSEDMARSVLDVYRRMCPTVAWPSSVLRHRRLQRPRK